MLLRPIFYDRAINLVIKRLPGPHFYNSAARQSESEHARNHIPSSPYSLLAEFPHIPTLRSCSSDTQINSYKRGTAEKCFVKKLASRSSQQCQ